MRSKMRWVDDIRIQFYLRVQPYEMSASDDITVTLFSVHEFLTLV